jgi:hypothetical protein
VVLAGLGYERQGGEAKTTERAHDPCHAPEWGSTDEKLHDDTIHGRNGLLAVFPSHDLTLWMV